MTPFQAIQEVRSLIWVPLVKALVKNVYPGEVALSEYDRAFNAKEKFVVVNFLTGDFEQLQDVILNVNIYAPDLYGVMDGNGLDVVHNAIKPLLEDAYTSLINTKLGRINILREEDKQYTFYNQRLLVQAVNLNQQQNIKL
ncbi:hypothetical protein [Niabella aurantiaca]|uniref:hypothetical protein n=1 Tax=Niabella aurantiaca TaxID=379900 RepID=UPI00037DE255|nr:hypothetical protein [Niabella aurantiaca]